MKNTEYSEPVKQLADPITAGAIEMQLLRLDTACVELEDTIQRLEHKFTPVLGTVMVREGAAAVAAPVKPMSSMAEWLSQKHSKLEDFNNWLENVLERCEL